MNSTIIGLLFILTGVAYGSLALDGIYNATLGWLVQNEWVKIPEAPEGFEKAFFGRKPTILSYSFALIALGVYILIKLD